MSGLEIYIYNLEGQVCLKFKTSLTVQAVHVGNNSLTLSNISGRLELLPPIGTVVIMTLLALFSRT